jgi:hypothetical protein
VWQSVMSEYDEPGEVFAALVDRERALALYAAGGVGGGCVAVPSSARKTLVSIFSSHHA